MPLFHVTVAVSSRLCFYPNADILYCMLCYTICSSTDIVFKDRGAAEKHDVTEQQRTDLCLL